MKLTLKPLQARVIRGNKVKATIVIWACVALCVHARQINLEVGKWDNPGKSIENGGFEDWGGKHVQIPGAEVTLGSEGAPRSWAVGCSPGAGAGNVSIMRDTLIKHSEISSVRLEVSGTRDGDLRQHISVEPDTSYLVRVWVRGKDIVPERPGGGIIIWANSGPTVGFWGNQKCMAKQPTQACGTFDWQLFEFPVTTSPEGERLIISLKLLGASGTAWFDDVEVVKSETVSR